MADPFARRSADRPPTQTTVPKDKRRGKCLIANVSIDGGYVRGRSRLAGSLRMAAWPKRTRCGPSGTNYLRVRCDLLCRNRRTLRLVFRRCGMGPPCADLTICHGFLATLPMHPPDPFPQPFAVDVDSQAMP